jgi:hypothetical protein
MLKQTRIKRKPFSSHSRYRICCIHAVHEACYFFDYGAKFKETIFSGTHRAELKEGKYV